MDNKELLPIPETNRARQLPWIASFDTKRTFVFSLAGAMLGLPTAVAPTDPTDWRMSSSIIAMLAVFLDMMALTFLSLSIFL
jgi:hypothetical protein